VDAATFGEIISVAVSNVVGERQVGQRSHCMRLTMGGPLQVRVFAIGGGSNLPGHGEANVGHGMVMVNKCIYIYVNE